MEVRPFPPHQIEPNLAGMVLGKRIFRFVQMKLIPSLRGAIWDLTGGLRISKKNLLMVLTKAHTGKKPSKTRKLIFFSMIANSRWLPPQGKFNIGHYVEMFENHQVMLICICKDTF